MVVTLFKRRQAADVVQTGNDLGAHGAIPLAAGFIIQKGKIIRGDAKWDAVLPCQADGFILLVGQLDERAQRICISNDVPHMPLPLLPFQVRGVKEFQYSVFISTSSSNGFVVEAAGIALHVVLGSLRQP